MSDHVYKTIELVGSSATSSDDAVQTITKAAATVRNMRWFEVVGMRGHIEAGRVAHWQATIKIGFTLE